VIATFHYAIEVDAANGSPLLGSRAQAIAAATPGVTRAEPVVAAAVDYHGDSCPALGLGPDARRPTAPRLTARRLTARRPTARRPTARCLTRAARAR
jgi:hypothetical protein